MNNDTNLLHSSPSEPSYDELSHLDAQGNARMVDVGQKNATVRTATAIGWVCFPPDVYQQIRTTDGQTKKGAIVEVARLAGIMGAKKTPDLIPLCHGLMLDKVDVNFAYEDEGHRIEVTATAKVTGKTGVEMEALTAVSVACLTIYDMTKALSHDIQIESIQLMSKAGGKRDFKRASTDMSSYNVNL